MARYWKESFRALWRDLDKQGWNAHTELERFIM